MHPNLVKDLRAGWEFQLNYAIQHPQCVGIGPSGFDFKRTPENWELQREVLRTHLDIAQAHDITIVVCLKGEEAFDKFLEMGIHHPSPIVLHGCTGAWDKVRALLDSDNKIFLGINGLILRNGPEAEAMREVVKNAPLDSIIIESGAPKIKIPHAKSLQAEKSTPGCLRRICQEILKIKNVVDPSIVDIRPLAMQIFKNSLCAFPVKSSGKVPTWV